MAENDDKVVKVGFGQIQNPTPKALTYLFRTYSFFAGIWVLIQPSLGVNHDLVAEINKWVLLGVPIIQFTIKFFGWDYKQQ